MRSLLLLVALTGIAHADNPRVVTRAWLAEQARDGFPILDTVDPQRGLVVIEHVVDVADESIPTVKTARKLCGDAKRLKALRANMQALHEHADVVSCHNGRDGVSMCTFQFAYEYSTAYSIYLKKNADGVLVPDAVLKTDAGSLTESFYNEMNAWVGKQWKKQRSTDCAGGAI